MTGGAGFIGSHLYGYLVKKGEEIICVDNFDNFYSPKIKKKNIKNLVKHNSFNLFNLNIITNGFVNRHKYYKELKNAKIAISPFGWGEICYKDFEIILAGTLMIKPSMNHLDTFPNIYFENKTYLPVRWDLSDLETVLENVLSKPNLCKNIIANAIDSYLSAYNDGEGFCKHFSEIINS